VTHINALNQLTIAGAISATFSRAEMKVLTSRFLAGVRCACPRGG
jgi:hypothetical protein